MGGELLQLVQVGVGHDHDVAVCVWICIENDVAMRPAVDDSGLFVAVFGSIAEDAPRLLGRASHVGVAPRSPEMVHGWRVAEAGSGDTMSASKFAGRESGWPPLTHTPTR